MKTLHLLRSEPDTLVRKLIDEGFGRDDNLEAPLYEGQPDYDELVRHLFASDRVISWW
jgi:hypothetical protein